jgi:DNA polymerase V
MVQNSLLPKGRDVFDTLALHIFTPELSSRFWLNYFQQPISAGFPSPADDYTEGKLDLNCHLVKNPAATFYVRVCGNSMTGVGIFSGDLLVVDRSLEPGPGKIVIAVLNGELTVKRLEIEGDRLFLIAENDSYSPIEVTESQDLCIWGVVTSAIHQFRC